MIKGLKESLSHTISSGERIGSSEFRSRTKRTTGSTLNQYDTGLTHGGIGPLVRDIRPLWGVSWELRALPVGLDKSKKDDIFLLLFFVGDNIPKQVIHLGG